MRPKSIYITVLIVVFLLASEMPRVDGFFFTLGLANFAIRGIGQFIECAAASFGGFGCGPRPKPQPRPPPRPPPCPVPIPQPPPQTTPRPPTTPQPRPQPTPQNPPCVLFGPQVSLNCICNPKFLC
ncbi:procyclic form-specific polypeptide B1-alpha-like [Zeugodacus cucurbitae]|uniref:procyclic form-specific polypeptide B1-alpha-like n=1 Tax=Zeugodacus cucurbitae TaxID=28588 RepID=UPI000596A23C|nr:procyclic form-specific polypeptide B1-alpha-like [Zeugodacus cucurbitae]